MQVIKISEKSGYAVNTNKFFKFERFNKECGDYVLIEGGFEQAHGWEQYGFTDDQLQKILRKKIVRLEFEEPNKFFVGDNPDNYQHYFYKIFTICPYTAEWLNKKHTYKKCESIYYPFNEADIPKKENKKYDVMYAGHIVSKHLEEELKTLTKFNYRLVSSKPHELVTDLNASHKEKMKIIAQTKITLVHNLLFPKLYHIPNIWRVPDYETNEALQFIPRWYQPWKFFNTKKILAPQIKSRLFEAAFGRSLILCRKDPFNLIERFFTPDKEFIYYEEGKLEEKIVYILKNYKKYERVVDNAYKRAIKQYTTKAFFENYLKKIK